jgi:uncharacterized membrane protein
VAPVYALKALHVLAACLFFGAGLASAWYKLRASRADSVAVVAWMDREVVLADWLFYALIGYTAAGLTWLPAAALQLQMRQLSAEALAAGAPLPPDWFVAQRRWALLGLPSFLAAVSTLWVMVTKQVPFVGQ